MLCTISLVTTLLTTTIITRELAIHILIHILSIYGFSSKTLHSWLCPSILAMGESFGHCLCVNYVILPSYQNYQAPCKIELYKLPDAHNMLEELHQTKIFVWNWPYKTVKKGSIGILILVWVLCTTNIFKWCYTASYCNSI